MITMKKKAGSYVGISMVLIAVGAAWAFISAANASSSGRMLGAVVLLMGIWIFYKNAVFCVVVDEQGVTQKLPFKKAQKRTWEELKLWLTFTPSGELASMILRVNEKNWCEMSKLKTYTDFDEGLKLIRRNLKISKMFNNKGEIPLSEEE